MKEDLSLLELKALEEAYKLWKKLIDQKKKEILDSIVFSLKDFPIKEVTEKGAEYIDTIINHTTQSSVKLKKSALVKELEENNNKYLDIENELKKRRKALFDALNIEQIDLLSLSSIEKFLEKNKAGKTPKKNNKNIVKLKDIQDMTKLKTLSPKYLNAKCVGTLFRKKNIQTYGDLIKVDIKELYAPLGDKSFAQVKKLIEDRSAIKN